MAEGVLSADVVCSLTPARKAETTLGGDLRNGLKCTRKTVVGGRFEMGALTGPGGERDENWIMRAVRRRQGPGKAACS